ncbi:piwi-like protein 1 [Paramacrobiotus metropolitanus]|uniref:piwi-like protein 1 n=1 Tax=Paramacrobiotus metropolitanus TaxID=2943436 RepID=UPI002446324D|nr:piwi-like protein 1 [Paramacrobiotus metropolitanus]
MDPEQPPEPKSDPPAPMETGSEPNSAGSDAMAAATEQARQLDLMNPTPLADKPSPPGGRGKGKGNGKYIGRDGKERISRAEEDRLRYTAVHTRPAAVKDEKKGSGGDVVRLHSNYIEVKVGTKGVIYQYQVDFDPQPGNRSQRYGIMHRWADKKQMVKHAYIFDGGSVLYVGPTAAELITEECEDAVEFNQQEMKVRMRRTANLDAQNPQVLVILNSQLNRFQEHDLKMVRIQDNCYDPAGKLEPEGYQKRLEIWPGFETSIGIFEQNRVLMSVDQRFRIIRNENARDALREAWSSAARTEQGPENIQKKAAKAVVGQTIETMYNHMVYRVQAVEWTKTPAKTFETRVRVGDKWEKKEITFGQYFADRYHMNVTDASQPLLVVKPANKALRRRGTEQILLVPELCRLTGYTDKIRADFRIMQAVSKHTKLDPGRRKNATEVFIRKLTGNENVQKELKHWDVQYGRELVKFQSRCLRPQQLSQSGRNYSYDHIKADWSTDMRGAQFQTAMELGIWLVLTTQPNHGITEQFVRQIMEVAGPMGMRVGSPKVQIVADTPQAYIEQVQKLNRPDLKLVMAVFSSNAKDRYDAFKETLCCNLPCASQVILAKTISGAPGKIKSVATKVCMQLNAKLGGDIWTMHFPFTAPTMVIGIDCHRDRMAQKTLVAAAAAWNKGFSRYYNCAVYADDDDQILTCIPLLVKECIEYFKAQNKCLPQGVFVYRDGISEGQLGNIKEIELAGVRNLTNGLSTDKKITLTYILVNKRESTRFFKDDNGNILNPLSGTIVDDIVTRPFRYDFYIVSQSVREGTVAPTYYNVIDDDSPLKPQHLQQMTYMLCHMYYNWPGTIRVPAPVQYARKHAQLIALNLHKKAADSLRERMFYL